jgi:hypothetical protein
VCKHLIKILGESRLQPFTIGGSHNTITACTLPTWLPEYIVDKMNEHFGGQLRRELVNVMKSQDLVRRRTPSSGSRRVSTDSNRSNPDDIEVDDETLEEGDYRP